MVSDIVCDCCIPVQALVVLARIDVCCHVAWGGAVQIDDKQGALDTLHRLGINPGEASGARRRRGSAYALM